MTDRKGVIAPKPYFKRVEEGTYVADFLRCHFRFGTHTVKPDNCIYIKISVFDITLSGV